MFLRKKYATKTLYTIKNIIKLSIVRMLTTIFIIDESKFRSKKNIYIFLFIKKYIISLGAKN